MWETETQTWCVTMLAQGCVTCRELHFEKTIITLKNSADSGCKFLCKWHHSSELETFQICRMRHASEWNKIPCFYITLLSLGLCKADASQSLNEMSNGRQPNVSSVCVVDHPWSLLSRSHQASHHRKKWNINSAHICTLMTTCPFKRKMTTSVLSSLSAVPHSRQSTWRASLI